MSKAKGNQFFKINFRFAQRDKMNIKIIREGRDNEAIRFQV